jgi:alpha-ketoglutarate-dependent taurine dioxygenase
VNPEPLGSDLRRRGRARPMVLSSEALVDAEPYAEDGHVLVARRAVAGVDLAAWARENQAWIDTALECYGGLLCRGFGIASAAALDRVMDAVAAEPLVYRERSSPRERVSDHVYTSTEHPPDQAIFLHNENSYQQTWPRRVFFCCVRPADSGGRTPVADTRRVFASIDPAVRQRFAERGVLYVRNYREGLGLPWQVVFQTTDRAAVEAYCRNADIACTWREGNRLTTRQVRPAIARHPRTGEMSWFNHATFFHVTTLEPSLREALLSQMPEEELPSNSYYGDGRAIEPGVLDELRGAYHESTRLFSWETGDLLLLDNLLMAHGREPYTGTRTTLVGLAAPMSWRDLV